MKLRGVVTLEMFYRVKRVKLSLQFKINEIQLQI